MVAFTNGLPVRSDAGGGFESWVYSLTPEQ